MIGRFVLKTHKRDALSVWTNLGKHLQFVWLCVPSIKTDTRRIMRLEELHLSLVGRRSRRSSSRRIMRLVPVFREFTKPRR